jgi:hypothetical protein
MRLKIEKRGVIPCMSYDGVIWGWCTRAVRREGGRAIALPPFLPSLPGQQAAIIQERGDADQRVDGGLALEGMDGFPQGGDWSTAGLPAMGLICDTELAIYPPKSPPLLEAYFGDAVAYPFGECALGPAQAGC